MLVAGIILCIHLHFCFLFAWKVISNSGCSQLFHGRVHLKVLDKCKLNISDGFGSYGSNRLKPLNFTKYRLHQACILGVFQDYKSFSH